MQKTSYHIFIEFNGKIYTELIIDQHYKFKHHDISDEKILKLIMKLNSLVLTPKDIKNEYSYYKIEPIFLDNRPYRIILVTETDKNYLGVINAFRIQGK